MLSEEVSYEIPLWCENDLSHGYWSPMSIPLASANRRLSRETSIKTSAFQAGVSMEEIPRHVRRQLKSLRLKRFMDMMIKHAE